MKCDTFKIFIKIKFICVEYNKPHKSDTCHSATNKMFHYHSKCHVALLFLFNIKNIYETNYNLILFEC